MKKNKIIVVIMAFLFLSNLILLADFYKKNESYTLDGSYYLIDNKFGKDYLLLNARFYNDNFALSISDANDYNEIIMGKVKKYNHNIYELIFPNGESEFIELKYDNTFNINYKNSMYILKSSKK